MRMSLISEKLQSSDWEHIQELLQDIRVQCGLLAGLVGVYLLRRALRTPKYNMPPGPWSLPLLGNLLSINTMDKMQRNFTKWRKQYGDVFTIQMGPMPCVVLMSTDVIRDAFITKGHDFDGRIRIPSTDSFTDGGKDIIFAQPTSIWKQQRMIAHAAIRKYASGATLENNMQSAFDSFVYGVTQQDGVIDLPVEMMKMSYNFLSTMCFGKQFAYDDPWLTEFIADFTKAVDAIGSGFISDFLPVLKFLDRKKLQGMEHVMRKVNELMVKEYAEHRQQFDANCPRDLIDEILLQLQKQQDQPEAKSREGETSQALSESSDEKQQSELTSAHLNQMLLDVFFAGTDTSRVTLSIMIGLVVEHPEVQKKLHQELDDVLGESGRVTLKLKDELAYTSAVLHEAMRMKVVAPIGFPHKTTRDTSLRGYTIPKDTMVIGYSHGIHMDPDNFKNPQEFNPDRWIDGDGKFQYIPYKFMPFSMGPRVCVGESLARTELVMFTAMLLHKYELEPLDVTKPFRTPFKDIQMSMDTRSFRLKLIDRHPKEVITSM